MQGENFEANGSGLRRTRPHVLPPTMFTPLSKPPSTGGARGGAAQGGRDGEEGSAEEDARAQRTEALPQSVRAREEAPGAHWGAPPESGRSPCFGGCEDCRVHRHAGCPRAGRHLALGEYAAGHAGKRHRRINPRTDGSASSSLDEP